MIRAIRPSAMAQDDAGLVSGWNVSPNVGYTVVLTPGSSACGALLFDAGMTELVASGAGLVGTAQPVILLPQTGQTIGMVDADLGWHLLLTTTGTEAQQTIRIGPAVDLPDEIHPVYSDDNMALARATSAINAGASYVDDVTVTCPLGLGAGLGDVVSVPVDGVAVVGQVESITWTGTPDGAIDQAVIRRHVAIAPEAFVEPVLPTVVDDTGETDADTVTTGNVLTNDASGLIVTAVNGMAANVGQIVAGSNGGNFVISADGSWTFDPDGDFAALIGSATATTSVTYHASNGDAEASATLTVTVSAASASMWDPSCMTTAQWLDADDVSTFSIESGLVSEWRDKSGNNRHVTQPTSSYRPTYAENAVNGKNAVLFSGKRLASTHTTSECEHHIFYVVSDPTSPNSGCAQTTGGTCLYNKNYGALSLADQGHKGESISSGAVGAFVHRSDNIHNVLYRAISMSGVNIAHFNWQVRLPYLSVNGVPVKTGVTAPQTTTFRYNVGYDNYGSYAGHVCERIIILGSLSESDRLRIEGYLAHKWGSADKLPEGHPYKSAPPKM